MAAKKFDVVVVGTGPGGYVSAIRCAQLGLSVAAIEDDRPGGVCLNWGCIPTKALLRNAEVVHLIQRAGDFGVTVGEVKADYAHAVKRSRSVADRMAKGVEFLFKKNKITLFPGSGTLKSKTTVEVKGAAGTETLEAARAIILLLPAQHRHRTGWKQVSKAAALRRDLASSRFYVCRFFHAVPRPWRGSNLLQVNSSDLRGQRDLRLARPPDISIDYEQISISSGFRGNCVNS